MLSFPSSAPSTARALQVTCFLELPGPVRWMELSRELRDPAVSEDHIRLYSGKRRPVTYYVHFLSPLFFSFAMVPAPLA